MILSPDTALLVYAHDAREPRKRQSALRIVAALKEMEPTLMGLQVAGELQAVLTRRLKQTPELASETVLSTLRMFGTFGYAESDVQTALALSARGVLSYWDGLLVSAAARAGCTHLISEDMHDGFRFGTLEIVAPFSDDGIAPRLTSLLGILRVSD